MQLATEQAHRTLSYVVAINDQGYRPTIDDVEQYATRPDARPAVSTPVWARSLSAVVAQALSWTMVESKEAETSAQYFSRLGWAVVGADRRVSATPLGRAACRALDARSVEPDTVTDIVLARDDPVALARVIQRIAEVGSALLVDPYFRLDQLPTVAHYTEVTRVLTSTRTKDHERAGLKLGTEALTLDHPLEIRVATDEVHDRYLIPDDGSVQFIGASLNGVGRVATAMGVVRDGSEQLRAMYEGLWEASGVLGNAIVRERDSET